MPKSVLLVFLGGSFRIPLLSLVSITCCPDISEVDLSSTAVGYTAPAGATVEMDPVDSLAADLNVLARMSHERQLQKR